MLCINLTVRFPLSVPVLSWLITVRRTAEACSSHQRPDAESPPPETRLVAICSQCVRQEPNVPNPKSQSFSRSYGSILPTSLIYIVLSTRGCSPWRPAAVMSTTWRENYSYPRIFKGRRARTGPNRSAGLFRPFFLFFCLFFFCVFVCF